MRPTIFGFIAQMTFKLLGWVRTLPRQSLDVWKAKGSKDSVSNAAEFVEKLLREHKPERLPPDIEKRLDSTAEEMTRSGVIIA